MRLVEELVWEEGVGGWNGVLGSCFDIGGLGEVGEGVVWREEVRGWMGVVWRNINLESR